MRLHQACHTEVQQTHLALVGDEDVRWFEVAANDAKRMRTADGIGLVDTALKRHTHLGECQEVT